MRKSLEDSISRGRGEKRGRRRRFKVDRSEEISVWHGRRGGSSGEALKTLRQRRSSLLLAAEACPVTLAAGIHSIALLLVGKINQQQAVSLHCLLPAVALFDSEGQEMSSRGIRQIGVT